MWSGVTSDLRDACARGVEDVRGWVESQGMGTVLGGAALTAGAGLALYIYTSRRDLPPGPPGWPIVGYAPHITEYFPQDFTKLGKIYGEVFSFFYGSRLVVVLNSHEAVKNAFLRRPEEFSYRPPEFDRVMQIHDEVFVPPYNENCKRTKKLASSWLRKVGLGAGNHCEAMVAPEIRNLMTYILSLGPGAVHEAGDLVYKLTGRIECLALFGERHEFDSPEMKYFTDIVSEWNKVVFGEAAIFGQIPTHTGAALWRRKWKRRIDEVSAAVRDYVREKVIRHRKNFDPNNLRDLVDNFIAEKGVDYDLDHMTGTTMILTPDTTDTMAISLMWILLYVGTYKEAQRKIQAEIDDVTREDNPSLSHRPRMTYTKAVLLEVLRMNSVFGCSFAHSTPWDRDIQFSGYRIPRGSFVFANFFGIHRDPTVFPEPEVFKPERFIAAEGHIVDSEKVLAFSSGKRMCMGEQQAKAVQFLFITHFLQKFDITFPADNPKPSTAHSYAGMATEMKPFKIVLTPRQK